MYFLLNTQLVLRPIFFCRHGRSEDNVDGRIGGDSALSPDGADFAARLRDYVSRLPRHERPKAVWTSTLRRTIETGAALADWPQVQWRALDEIDAGACDGMRYDEIKRDHPAEYTARQADKLRYRYPRGESYLDVVKRLEPVIIELERQRQPVLVIAHRAVLRCLYAYFLSRSMDDVPHLAMPLHHVVKLMPGSYGVQEEWTNLMPEEGGAGGSGPPTAPVAPRGEV